MGPPSQETGQYGRWELPALLLGYVRRLCDGRLDLGTGGVMRSIWLDAGQVRAVVSDLAEERLGVWLCTRGLLDQLQLNAALGKVQEGALFGTVLVTEGYLELDRLQSELDTRFVAVLTRLLPTSGSYRFLSGERFCFDSLELSRSSAAFVVAATREIKDASDLSSVIDETRVLCVTEDPAVVFQKVQLLPHEAFLLSRIDGTTSLAQLRKLVPMSTESLTRAIVALWAGGFVELGRKATTHVSAPSTPTPPPSTLRPLAPVPATTAFATGPEPAQVPTEFTPLQRREREDILHFAAEIRFHSYYRRLGIETTAGPDQVKRAFAEQARRFHPDRASEPHLHFLRRELAEIYHCLEEAAEALASPAERAAYDRKLQDKRTLTDDPFASEKGREEARRQIVVANIRKADELAKRGDLGGAVTLLEQAVRFRPEPSTLVALARLQLRNPMWINRALDHLRHAVAMEPQYTEAWLEMARFWAHRSQAARCRECTEKILAYDPHHVEARELLRDLKAR